MKSGVEDITGLGRAEDEVLRDGRGVRKKEIREENRSAERRGMKWEVEKRLEEKRTEQREDGRQVEEAKMLVKELR